MSEYTVVAEASVLPLPDDVPFEVAAITGCAVMTGVGAVMNTAKVIPGSSAALIGCGGIGLSILLGLKMAGCYPLIAVDVMNSKLEFARSLGATHTVNAKNEDAVEAIRGLTGKGANYVFDSVGNAVTIAQAVAAAGPAAVIALEAGWTTTEVGRQPWIAQQVMLVSDAVTPRQGIGWLLIGLIVVYGGLAASAVVVLRAMSARWRNGEDPGTPYGPDPLPDDEMVAV